MSREILLLVDALAREKMVEKDIVFTALELALASATKNVFTRMLMQGYPSTTRPETTSPSAAGKWWLTMRSRNVRAKFP